MTQSDLELLLEMGFPKERAELAVKKNGGLQGALTWLEENQDKSLEELQANSAADDEEEAVNKPDITAVEDGASAMSLVCNECGKKFRTHDQASFHASKTEHTDFSESTEEIAPLTEEEKKQRLEELRQKLKEKKANQALMDKEDQKANEKIRMKSTKESQDLKEEVARKEQIKDAARKRQEKLDDAEAKKRIKAKIEADRLERQRKNEEAKARREGRAIPSVTETAAPAPASMSESKPTVAAHDQARLRLQTPSGNLMKTFAADTTLFEVAAQVEADKPGFVVNSFSTTFPKKDYVKLDFGMTLKEANMVPSAVVIVK